MKVLLFALLATLINLAIFAKEPEVSIDFSQGIELKIFLQWFAEFTNKKIIIGQVSQLE